MYDIIVLYKQMRGTKMLNTKDLEKKERRLNLFSTKKSTWQVLQGLDEEGYYEEYFGA